MWQKRILGSLWIMTMLIIFIVTFVNNKPYFIMGGSTSVSPLMHTLMDGYPENHKDADFTYNSLGSDAAIIPVDKGMFGIGWLSKEYTTSNPNQISFVLSLDGMILVYNLPPSELGNDNPLNFNQEIVKKMYLTNGNVYWKDLFPQDPAHPNEGWVKPTSTLKVTTYTRENGSGTRDVFNEKVLGDKTAYYPQATTVNSSTQMFSMAPGGIGYSSYSDKKQLDSNPSFANVYMGNWEHTIPTLDNISHKRYGLARPFTGVINEKYKQINTLVKFLKFLFYPSDPNHHIVDAAFSEANYAQAAVPLDDPSGVNNKLDTWLKKFPEV
ncbi:substrate-binding domain-containing protein [Spiroplasma sp. AdecLV25b]|uniref:PstS family phosphate ABC transporter substrate-binding protein n=1 Tax=Spiroplasma sp. AdecLV25b TaxID=3027162 RepID=UPI0027E1B241|nr:substrate-binding domain-containing protein [Spiroplasma sp. AdecLV25b]